ncbi:MAG: ASKHA domain-containing protein [Synergistaceae bacterium]|nr:ASKHA domain-containing protein [Synergistaceae bacterium]
MQKLALNFIGENKEKKIVLADYGTTIKDAADENEILLATHCGGAGICGACRVKILQGHVSNVTQTERQFLSEQELKDGIRLACKTKILGDLVIESSVTESNIKILDSTMPFETTANANSGLGVALDLGTTSVVLTVLDIKNGQNLGYTSFANPQATFGSDVMSRIASVSSNPANLQKMQQSLLDSLVVSITELLRKNNRSEEEITKIVVSGNTVMQHILVGESPVSMGSTPYISSFLYHQPIKADKFSLPFEKAKTYFVPNISAFVGGDVTSGLTALNFDQTNKKEATLFIDLGTNNEMVLLAKGQILATATAAGPAFEGAGISCGVRATSGAICSVSFENGKFVTHTIDNSDAIGLCGSGMIDCLALFLENNIMEKNGSLNPDNPFVCKNENGVLQVVLTEEKGKKKVYITQKDIRSLQLVIASIKAGVKILLKEAKIDKQEMNKIYLAGAFGNYIDIANARVIGLLPACEAEIISAKNTSLLGAIQAILQNNFLPRAITLSKIVKSLNLANEADFQENFINSLDF